jgi:site-specific recombinase XerD
MPMHKQHMQCDFSYKDKLPGIFPEVFPQANKAIAEIETSPSEPIAKVIEEFRKEKIQTRSWKPRTVPEADRALNHFKDNIGEKTPIHSIDGKALRQYKQGLLDEEYKPGKTRSISTINDKYLTFVKALFVFARDNHYIEKNPAKGLSIKVSQKKKSHKKQEIFTDEDLKKLFCESSEFGEDRHAFSRVFSMNN